METVRARELVAELQDQIALAEERIRSHIRTTYLEYSPLLSEQLEAEIYLKLENLQVTGSFKFRGALNKTLALDPVEARKGILTASTGNHGLAVAEALKRAGYPGTIYLPPKASPAKVNALGRYPVELRFHGDDPIEAELEARRLSREQGRPYISPYNDLEVVAGQGTLGRELVEQLPEVEMALIAVGGGGLISGTAAALKQHNSKVRIVGCLPERSPAMYECVKAGRVVSVPTYETLSDGTAGGVEVGSITLSLCQALVDDYCLLSEPEILTGMRYVLEQHHQVVEGSAGLSVAAAQQLNSSLKGKRVVLLMCGGNVSMQTLRRVVG